MKKITLRIFLVVSITFLTGCRLWKKKENKDINQPIVMTEQSQNSLSLDNNPCVEINFDENANSYQVVSGKSIFADDEIISNIEENNSNNNSNNEEEVNLLIDNQIENTPKEVFIERDKVHLGTVLFDFDKYEVIRNDYNHILKSTIHYIQSILINNPNAKIIIEGHACNSCGSERYNLDLSNNRALAIKDQIIQNTSINEDNISVFGCGTSHLIVHGDRSEQSPNRRVEIFIVN